MRATKIIMVVTAIMIALISVFLRNVPGILRRVDRIQETYAREKQRKEMHKSLVDIASLPALKDETNAWYTKYHVIAHAGGGYDGKIYTNCREAWEHSYARGTRIFDADCSFTTDGRLVLRHDWRDNLEQRDLPMYKSKLRIGENGQTHYKILKGTEETDFETFMQRKIFHKYMPLSCEDMIRLMQTHEDLYVATDAKGKQIVKVYTYLVETAKQIDAEEILNRIIVSIYDYENYQEILKIYPFKNFAFRQNPRHNYYELTAFCVENNIHVVNVMQSYMEDEGIKLLTDKGIHVFAAVVDYVSDMKEYRKLGSTGCVSNFLYEDMWSLTEP